MQTRTVVTLAIAFVLTIPSYGQSPAEPETERTVEVITCYGFVAPDDQPESYPTFTICPKDLVGEPHWRGPEWSPPPLRMSDAIAIARMEIGRYSKVLEWEIGQVAIRRIRVGGMEKGVETWVYLVRWRATRLHDLVLEIPVLMSGKVLEGSVREAS